MAENFEIPFLFAKNNGVLIEKQTDDEAVILHRENVELKTLQELRRHLLKPIQLHQVSDEDFTAQLTRIYESKSDFNQQIAENIEEELDLSQLISDLPQNEDLLEKVDDAPIIKLLNVLLTQAIKQKASDLHFEIFEDRMAVRFRVDGTLREVMRLQRAVSSLVISRLKVMAKLDIAEKRVPQDGRITLRIAGRQVDVRVSTIPTGHGERVVLRLLDTQAAKLQFKDLGLLEDNEKAIKSLISQPHGIILVTGPTGSGKTTTLYAALSYLNKPTRNILTVEDPIEYFLSGIGQTQVNSKVEMTFARGLRAILRQDPDVVMVGEIRDLETAKVAVQASLTGHLVLSTLHTNSAIGAIARMRDMGVESFLLSSSLIGVAAQRLIRLLCPDCKEPYQASEHECQMLEVDPSSPPTIYKGKGCEKCQQSGYLGRTAIYEIVPISPELNKLIHDDASDTQLTAEARKYTRSMQADGHLYVKNGTTSIEEIMRVTGES